MDIQHFILSLTHLPGIQPRQVNKQLMSKSQPQPRSPNTPKGGKITAVCIIFKLVQ